MKNTLKLEEAAMLTLGMYLFTLLHFDWWIFLVLFLAPDIGMLGYFFGNKTGAMTYNIFHHKGIALGFYFLGLFLANEWLQLVGVILFSHSAFDRIVGYGLKYEKGFKFTHLGKIGGGKS